MALRGTLVRDGKLLPFGRFLLGGLGVLFTLAGIAPVVVALPVLIAGERARAKVVMVRNAEPPVRGWYVVELEFQGRRVPMMRREYRNYARMRMDQIVRIAYDRDDPRRVELLDVGSDWMGGIVSILVGIGLVVFGAVSPRGQ